MQADGAVITVIGKRPTPLEDGSHEIVQAFPRFFQLKIHCLSGVLENNQHETK
jgi:hypothetical protein